MQGDNPIGLSVILFSIILCIFVESILNSIHHLGEEPGSEIIPETERLITTTNEFNIVVYKTYMSVI